MIIANPDQSLTLFALINTKDKTPLELKSWKKGRECMKETLF